jgi:hypothetical protein
LELWEVGRRLSEHGSGGYWVDEVLASCLAALANRRQ